MPPLWPHQPFGVNAVLAAIARGARRVVLTSPTGGGKTAMMKMLAQHYMEQGRKVVIYTNRRLLLEQTADRIGLDHGVRAAGHEEDRDELLQVSSIQTEDARVFKRAAKGRLGAWELHQAELVLVDECHSQTGKVARKVIGRHLDAGAAVVGVTATPLDIGDLYEELIVAGTNSELRACGALVPALHFAPDEPDLSFIGKVALDRDLTEPEVRKAFPPTQMLFGRVLDHYHKLNPERKPTILFASGVPESRWFTDQFNKVGVKAVHIDGDNIWTGRGVEYKSDPAARADLFAAFKARDVEILTCRYVLREGVDLPAVEHLIFSTIFNSLTGYLQSVGRGLRASPGKTQCVIQDHAGLWWRFGSANADRHWSLQFGSGMMQALRADRIREGKEPEPRRCPQCARVMSGSACPGCGWEAQGRPRTRMVVTTDGELREQTGNVYNPRKRFVKDEELAVWTQCYYRAKNSRGGMSFREAEGLFVRETGHWPPRTLPLMPTKLEDWFRLVKDVPPSELIKGRKFPQRVKTDDRPGLYDDL